MSSFRDWFSRVDFVLSSAKHLFLDIAWNDDDAVEVRKHQFARLHEHLATAHRHITGHHKSTALRIEGTNAGIINREPEFHDFQTIPDLTVADTANRSIFFRNRGHQLAPGCVGATVIGGMNHDVSRFQRIHQLDL